MRQIRTESSVGSLVVHASPVTFRFRTDMMTLLKAAQAIGAQASGPDAAFSGVTTDSRNLAQGDLFVALKGERFDGHAFVTKALEQGASVAMVERGWSAPRELSLLRVDDTRLALGRLAKVWRARFSGPLVAITGSNGKTTVKEMAAAILRAQLGANGKGVAGDAVLATQGNLNNDIGVPIMLLRLRDEHRYAVIEMGMNHRGEISYLSALTTPAVAVINNAHRAHIGLLGSVEAIARAKGEILEGLADEGVAVINADDPHAYIWRELAGARRRTEFALSQPAHVRARYTLAGFGSHLEFSTPVGDFNIYLQVPGVHNIHNALAACAVGVALELSPASIAAGLSAFCGAKGRMQRKAGAGGALIIDDTYNANPDSVLAALDVLEAMPEQKIFVLGDMGELGADGARLHTEIGARAKGAGVTMLLAVGELSRGAVQKFGSGAKHFPSVEQLIVALKPLLKSGVTVLVKGSRFMQMERVVTACEA